MAVTSRQVAMVRRVERAALRKDAVPITKLQAKVWCAVHVGEDWYKIPVMLVSKGCNGDYSHWTEIAPDSVYELDDTGCYIELADWWTSYQLWKQDWYKHPKKIELYNDGEYCEDVLRGKTCIDRFDNTKCNPCLRRIENMNS